MRETDLLEELAAAHMNLTPHHLDFLNGQGIARRSLYDFEDDRLAGHFGVDRVQLRRDGGYQLDNAGDHALILAVRDGVELVDLLALRSDRQEHWGLRLGVGTILGPGSVERAEAFGTPQVFWPTPWEWLRADCTGSVLLSLKPSPKESTAEVRDVA